MPIVKPIINPCQYGIKGSSVRHYLIKVLQFIHTFLNLREPHAVVLSTIDLSKAFNHVSHQMASTSSYFVSHGEVYGIVIWGSHINLKTLERKLSSRSLPRHFSFHCEFNGAILRPSIPRINFTCSKSLVNCDILNCGKHTKVAYAIYIDDLSELDAVNLQKQLVLDQTIRPRPLVQNDRSGNCFYQSSSQLQKKA